jgi:hypothetical protein
MTLQELANAGHPYYCHDNNYYSNEAAQRYKTFKQFIEEWADADKDYNLLFRWDVTLRDEDKPEKGYSFSAFYILQRKGIFMPITVDKITEEDVPTLMKFISGYWDIMKKIWQPISQ